MEDSNEDSEEFMDDDKGDIIHKVKNHYADRYVWFFSDPPHLLKTARNCLMKSGTTRHM